MLRQLHTSNRAIRQKLLKILDGSGEDVDFSREVPSRLEPAVKRSRSDQRGRKCGEQGKGFEGKHVGYRGQDLPDVHLDSCPCRGINVNQLEPLHRTHTDIFVDSVVSDVVSLSAKAPGCTHPWSSGAGRSDITVGVQHGGITNEYQY
jgi:hypothetical protein